MRETLPKASGSHKRTTEAGHNDLLGEDVRSGNTIKLLQHLFNKVPRCRGNLARSRQYHYRRMVTILIDLCRLGMAQHQQIRKREHAYEQRVLQRMCLIELAPEKAIGIASNGT